MLYCGYRFDPESGLYQVRHRYLTPVLGRWTNRDPIGYVDGGSLYAAFFAMRIATDPQGLELYRNVDIGGKTATLLDGSMSVYKWEDITDVAFSDWSAWNSSTSKEHNTSVVISQKYNPVDNTCTRIIRIVNSVDISWTRTRTFIRVTHIEYYKHIFGGVDWHIDDYFDALGGLAVGYMFAAPLPGAIAGMAVGPFSSAAASPFRGPNVGEYRWVLVGSTKRIDNMRQVEWESYTNSKVLKNPVKVIFKSSKDCCTEYDNSNLFNDGEQIIFNGSGAYNIRQ